MSTGAPCADLRLQCNTTYHSCLETWVAGTDVKRFCGCIDTHFDCLAAEECHTVQTLARCAEQTVTLGCEAIATRCPSSGADSNGDKTPQWVIPVVIGSVAAVALVSCIIAAWVGWRRGWWKRCGWVPVDRPKPKTIVMLSPEEEQAELEAVKKAAAERVMNEVLSSEKEELYQVTKHSEGVERELEFMRLEISQLMERTLNDEGHTILLCLEEEGEEEEEMLRKQQEQLQHQYEQSQQQLMTSSSLNPIDSLLVKQRQAVPTPQNAPPPKAGSWEEYQAHPPGGQLSRASCPPGKEEPPTTTQAPFVDDSAFQRQDADPNNLLVASPPLPLPEDRRQRQREWLISSTPSGGGASTSPARNLTPTRRKNPLPPRTDPHSHSQCADSLTMSNHGMNNDEEDDESTLDWIPPLPESRPDRRSQVRAEWATPFKPMDDPPLKEDLEYQYHRTRPPAIIGVGGARNLDRSEAYRSVGPRLL